MNVLLFCTIALLVIWGLVHVYLDVKKVRDWRVDPQNPANLALHSNSTDYDGLISAVAEGATGIGEKTVSHSDGLAGEASTSEAAVSGVGHLLHNLAHFIHH